MPRNRLSSPGTRFPGWWKRRGGAGEGGGPAAGGGRRPCGGTEGEGRGGHPLRDSRLRGENRLPPEVRGRSPDRLPEAGFRGGRAQGDRRGGGGRPPPVE